MSKAPPTAAAYRGLRQCSINKKHFVMAAVHEAGFDEPSAFIVLWAWNPIELSEEGVAGASACSLGRSLSQDERGPYFDAEKQAASCFRRACLRWLEHSWGKAVPHG